MLKKEERIEALALIMVVCLLIYSFAEWLIRKGLKETGQSIPDQKGKPKQKPTLKWFPFLFYDMAEVIVEIGKDIHREIANLKEALIIAIRILGRKCENYYGFGGVNPECGYMAAEGDTSMNRQSKIRRRSPEVIRKRIENSLPFSLSRWFASLWRKKK